MAMNIDCDVDRMLTDSNQRSYNKLVQETFAIFNPEPTEAQQAQLNKLTTAPAAKPTYLDERQQAFNQPPIVDWNDVKEGLTRNDIESFWNNLTADLDVLDIKKEHIMRHWRSSTSED